MFMDDLIMFLEISPYLYKFHGLYVMMTMLYIWKWLCWIFYDDHVEC